MKPTQQEIIELAREVGVDAWWDSGNEQRKELDDLLGRLVHLALERFGAGGGEPVYAFRRKGQGSFCTCDESRYLELSEKPTLFEVQIFYTHPSPTDLRAEYLRGLEDAKAACQHAAYKLGNELMVAHCAEAIEALKGKQ